MIVSQSRHENFSRTVWITFHCRGITSSVSVTSSPSFDSFFDPQQDSSPGRDHHALARQMVGEGLAGRPPALERRDGLCPRRRLLGRQFILGCRRFQLFELKLHLLQQPCLALRAGAIELAPQLLDLELEWLMNASVLDRSAWALAASARATASLASASTRAAAQQGSARAQRQDRRKHLRASHNDGITSITIRKPKASPHRCRPPRLLRCLQSIPDRR